MATVRRVRRIIRKIDPWTALKVSAVVWAVVAIAMVLGSVIFWSVFERAGIPAKLTSFMVEITLIDEGSQPFANVEQFFRVVVFGSVVWWVLATGTTVLMAITYNLVSDVVGGLEVVVLEETLNPVVMQQQVLHPPTDYRPTNGSVAPSDQADIPTEETAPVTVPLT
jgi:fructose-specific phosphotransferase system IIC component